MDTLKARSTTPDAKGGQRPPKLLDQVRDKILLKHYSIRTQYAYVDWVKLYV